MPQVPSEEQVRRFFQESYYTTYSHDSETGKAKKSSNTDGIVYPREPSDE